MTTTMINFCLNKYIYILIWLFPVTIYSSLFFPFVCFVWANQTIQTPILINVLTTFFGLGFLLHCKWLIHSPTTNTSNENRVIMNITFINSRSNLIISFISAKRIHFHIILLSWDVNVPEICSKNYANIRENIAPDDLFAAIFQQIIIFGCTVPANIVL